MFVGGSRDLAICVMLHRLLQATCGLPAERSLCFNIRRHRNPFR